MHPPVPICPRCRGRRWEAAPVSGLGTVVGFTVNMHQWLPGFDPPYAIAIVALAEDVDVRLTTNVVGCDPHDVHIGQEVRVRFEQHEDVWLPLFEPTGATDASDRLPPPHRPLPRAPLNDERFEHRAVLSGIGRSAIGDLRRVSGFALRYHLSPLRLPGRRASQAGGKELPRRSGPLGGCFVPDSQPVGPRGRYPRQL